MEEPIHSNKWMLNCTVKKTDLYVIFFFFGNLQLRISILEM